MMTSSLYALSDANVPHLWESSDEMVEFLATPLTPAELLHHLWIANPEDEYFGGTTPALTMIERHPELAENEPEFWEAADRALKYLSSLGGMPATWSTDSQTIALSTSTSTPESWSSTQRAIAVRAVALVEQHELSEQWLRDVFSSDFFATAGSPRQQI